MINWRRRKTHAIICESLETSWRPSVNTTKNFYDHDDVIKWKHFPVTGEFPSQRPVTRSFDVFFDLRLNKQLNKHLRRWQFETPSHHHDVTVLTSAFSIFFCFPLIIFGEWVWSRCGSFVTAPESYLLRHQWPFHLYSFRLLMHVYKPKYLSVNDVFICILFLFFILSISFLKRSLQQCCMIYEMCMLVAHLLP